MPPLEIGPLELLIFQGTPFCNIDCKYCYLPDRLNTGKMSLDIVRQSIHKLVKEKVIRDDFTVLWHSGEPLVMPIEFYEEAFTIIQNAVPGSYHVTFAIQTNGILINDAWCRFFNKHEVEVGLSVDGPEFIHDRNRITRSGKGTFSKVIKAIGLIQEYDMRLDIISVLTAFSCDYPEIMYDFFKNIGTDSVSFNVEEMEGVNKISSFTNLQTSQDRVKKFLSVLYRLNLSDGEPFQIKEFNWAKNTLLHSDLDPDEIMFTQMTGPFKTITVSSQGNFSTFSPEFNTQKSIRYGDFILGNVLNDSFIHSISSKQFKHIYGDLVKGLRKCKKNCGYYGLCPGGVPSSKFSEHQSLNTDETLYCKLALQTPIDTLLEMVMEEATVQTVPTS